jgi:chitosanase
MGAGTSIATTAALAWVPGSSPSGTNDIRQPVIQEMAFEMTSTAENSRTDWYSLTAGPAGQDPPYAYCEDIFDGRGYTAGLVGFCSGTGDMLELIQNYATAKPNNNTLSDYIPKLQECADIGSNDGDYVSNGGAASDAAATKLGPDYITAWHNAAMNDPIFRRVQREYRKAHYWDDALTQALADGVGPLGMCIYYDVLVNHGPGDDSESFGGILSYVRTNSAASRPSTGSAPNQTTWLNALVDRRNTILQGWDDDQATDGRVFFHRNLISSGNFNLTGDVTWTCYGDDFSFNRPQPPAEGRTGAYVLRYTATGVGTDDVTVTVA